MLDAEIVALNTRGPPSFSQLQQRMHVRDPARTLLDRVPIHLFLFDVLHLGADSTLGLPYTQSAAPAAGAGLGR